MNLAPDILENHSRAL